MKKKEEQKLKFHYIWCAPNTKTYDFIEQLETLRSLGIENIKTVTSAFTLSMEIERARKQEPMDAPNFRIICSGQLFDRVVADKILKMNRVEDKAILFCKKKKGKELEERYPDEVEGYAGTDSKIVELIKKLEKEEIEKIRMEQYNAEERGRIFNMFRGGRNQYTTDIGDDSFYIFKERMRIFQIAIRQQLQMDRIKLKQYRPLMGDSGYFEEDIAIKQLPIFQVFLRKNNHKEMRQNKNRELVAIGKDDIKKRVKPRGKPRKKIIFSERELIHRIKRKTKKILINSEGEEYEQEEVKEIPKPTLAKIIYTVVDALEAKQFRSYQHLFNRQKAVKYKKVNESQIDSSDQEELAKREEEAIEAAKTQKEYERYKNVLGVYESPHVCNARFTVENYTNSHVVRRKKPIKTILWVDMNVNPDGGIPVALKKLGRLKCFKRIEDFYHFLDRENATKERFTLIFANNFASHVLQLEKKPRNRHFPYRTIDYMILFCGDENRGRQYLKEAKMEDKVFLTTSENDLISKVHESIECFIERQKKLK